MFKRLSLVGPLVLPLLAIGGLVVAFVMFSGIRELVPPRSVTMAAGRPGGGYQAIAERYAAILARDGIELRILDTAGSLENAALMAEGAADVALLQGGTPMPEAAAVQALGAVFVEPMLLFARPDFADATDPVRWPGAQVAVGEEGSGTRLAMMALLSRLEIDVDADQLLPLGGAEAADALIAGEVDVAGFVARIEAPYLQPLLRDPGIRVGSLRDAETLARLFPFAKAVDIPAGGIDYVARLPLEPIPVVATVATLAAQTDLHPALVNRFVRAAQEIHAGPSLLSADLRFPSVEGTVLPMDVHAREMLLTNPSGLERLLPYWASAQITRLTILLLPLLVLLVPLVRMVPGLYAWRMRSRVYRRYTELIEIDAEAEGSVTDARRAKLLDRLDAIDQEAKAVQVPLRYREYVYTLRVHIDLVRRKLTEASRAEA